MTRKLLPFEHDLIAALGVSKDEYLQFLALQEEYGDWKAGTYLDIRNGPAAVPIILTVVGIVFQVASALLAPRPSVPQIAAPRQQQAPQQESAGQPQTRDERFSPRFGFNSQQELAAYGDPVNLVYANRGTGAGANPNGGVRVASSLLWSAVRSYGSSQFVQMLLMLSGGGVSAIDAAKSSFGQTPVRDFTSQNIWMYFNPGGTGLLQRQYELNDRESTDPTAYGSATDNPYRLQPTTANTRVDGFSQAYSPSSNNSVGIYGVVPINVQITIRNAVGDGEGTLNGITASGIGWTSGTSTAIDLKDRLTLTLARTQPNTADSDVVREAKDHRRSIVSVFDQAGIFKLGTATFRVVSISGTAIDEADVVVVLECIAAGRSPEVTYASTNVSGAQTTTTAPLQSEYDRLRPTVLNLLNADQNPSISSAVQLANAGAITVPSYTQNKVTTYYNAADVYAGRVQAEYDSRGRLIRWYRWETVFNGYVVSRYLTSAEISSLRRYDELEQSLNASTSRQNDIFYTKALVRVATAQYETVSTSHIVDFALKAVVYKRINGRQLEYGTGRRSGYPVSDNGIKSRVVFFKLKFKQVGQTSFDTIPVLFAISRAADNENFVFVKFSSGITDPQAAIHWNFEFEPVADPKAETDFNSKYLYLENSGTVVTETLSEYKLSSGSSITPTIQFVGRSLPSSGNGYPPLNNNPSDLNEWDLFNLSADTQLQLSLDAGPEITITAVTEQLIQPFSDYTTRNSSGAITQELYKNLALFGFNAYSGKEMQDLRSFSVFATQGRSVRRIRTSGNDEQGRSWGSSGYTYYPANPDGASSLAPDIFLDTVLDKEDGIGNFAVVSGIDLRQLALTKRFCIRNNLFMDCLLASSRSWREFWVEVAPFSLLEFARIGGRETLVPAVPYNPDTGEITRTVNVSAIFNTGNILEDSYKEEYMDYGSNVQDVIAEIIYTEVPTDAIFSKKKTVQVQRRDTLEADAARQAFDLSAYVSSFEQAVLFGKLICNTRRYVRQAVEFKTYPTSDPISPGAFIYVDIGQNSWDAIHTGIIATDGTLNTPLSNTPVNGTYNFKLYRSDRGLISLNNVTITNGRSDTLRSYEGFLFVLGIEATSRRVFRVSEVQMDEEGETTIRATSYPCTSDGLSLLADFSDTLFTVRS